MTSPHDHKDGLARLQDKQAALQAIVQVMAGSVQLDVLPVFEEALVQITAALKAPMAALHLLGGEEDKLTLVHHEGLDPVWSRAWANLKLDGGSPPALVHLGGKGLELSGDEASSESAHSQRRQHECRQSKAASPKPFGRVPATRR